MDYYFVFTVIWCVSSVSCSPITTFSDQSNLKHLELASNNGPESSSIHAAVPIHVRITRNTNTDQTISITSKDGTPIRIHIIPKDQQNSSQSNNTVSIRQNNVPTGDTAKPQKINVNIKNESEITINNVKENDVTEDSSAAIQPSDEPSTEISPEQESNEPVVVPETEDENKVAVVIPAATVVNEEPQVVTIQEQPKTVIVQEVSKPEEPQVVTIQEQPKTVIVQEIPKPLPVVMSETTVIKNEPQVVTIQEYRQPETIQPKTVIVQEVQKQVPESPKYVVVQASQVEPVSYPERYVSANQLQPAKQSEVVYVQQVKQPTVYYQSRDQPEVVYVDQPEQANTMYVMPQAYTVQQRPSTGVHSIPSARERITPLSGNSQQNVVYVQPQSDIKYVVMQPENTCPSSCEAKIDKVCGESEKGEMEDFDNFCQLQVHNCHTTPRYPYYRKGKCPMNVYMSTS